MRSNRSARVTLASALLASVGGGIVGCTYERVVSVQDPFEGLRGSENGGEVRRRAVGASGLSNTDTRPAREELDDGSVVLRSRNPRELLRHVYETLARNEETLFAEQVLSARTRALFYERGFEPEEAYRRAKARERDIRELLERLPSGEVTPGSEFRPVGAGRFLLRVVDEERRELAWTSVEMVVEAGEWKLGWFGAL